MIAWIRVDLETVPGTDREVVVEDEVSWIETG
jgi:hypothetical protein